MIDEILKKPSKEVLADFFREAYLSILLFPIFGFIPWSKFPSFIIILPVFTIIALIIYLFKKHYMICVNYSLGKKHLFLYLLNPYISILIFYLILKIKKIY